MKHLKAYSILLFFLSICFAFSCNTEKAEQVHFRFVFMTDIHLQPERGAVQGFKAAIEKVNSLHPKPAFTITGGDLVYDAMEQNFKRADSLYNLYIETSKLFNMPVYNTFGNHDIFGHHKKANMDSSHPEYAKKMFTNRLGTDKTYRSFNYNDWHFILLDAVTLKPGGSYTGKIDSSQMEWLKTDLEEVGKNRPIVIVTHIPFYTIFNQYFGHPTKSNDENLVVTNANEVMEICKDYNLKLVLQGHLHTVEEIKFYDVSYIVGGAVCGNKWKGLRHEFPEGFVVVDIIGDEFDWKYETFNWDASKYN